MVNKQPVQQEPIASEQPVQQEPIASEQPVQQEPMVNDTEVLKQKNKEFADSQREQITDLADLYRNRHEKYSTQGKSILGSLGGVSSYVAGALNTPELKMEARRDVIELNKHIATKLAEEGINAFIHPNTGELMYKDEEGNEQEIDSYLLNDLWNSKLETVGGIAGAIAGGQAANIASAGILPVTPPTAIAKGLIVAGGAIAGGFAGAASGRTFDLLNNSLAMKEELEAGLVINQAIEAGYYDTVTTIIGGTALKGIVGTVKVGWKGVGKAYGLVVEGNSKGALDYLKKSFNLSDDAAKEITEKFIDTLEEDIVIPAGRVSKMLGAKDRVATDTEKSIVAITSTVSGAEELLAKAASNKLKIADSMYKNVDFRAKDISKLVNNFSDPNVGMTLRKNIYSYEKEVKGLYKEVKKIGSDLVDGKTFSFNTDQLGLTGLMEGIASNNKSNPDYLTSFGNFITDISIRSEDKTFNGLIDLRQSVNNFKYSKLLSNTNKVKGTKTEFDAVNEVLNNIDSEINKAVKEFMPKDVAKEWSDQWRNAKKQYSKMSIVKNNAIYKEVVNTNATEASIQSKLNKYGNDLDVDKLTFNMLMNRVVDKPTKIKIENAGVKNLLNKYTKGTESGYQSVDFKGLHDELKGLNITTKENRMVVNRIKRYSDLFNIENELGGIKGGVSLKGNDSSGSMSTTLMGRAQVQANNTLFSYIASYNPLKKLRGEDALIGKLEVLMADPLKQRSVDNLLKILPADEVDQARSIIKEAQIAMVRAGEKAESRMTKGNKSFKKMYKASSTGKFVKSNGALGRGIYLTDKVNNTGANIIGTEINLSKMIDIDKVSGELGRVMTLKEIRESPLIRQELIDKGYKGLMSGDNKAMLFESVD